MKMDWTHSEEASMQYHQAGADMESSRETEEGKAQTHVAEGSTSRHKTHRKDMATAGEGSTGQRALEDSCGWPMPLLGSNGLK